jgi:hypothetical protein
MAACHVSGDGTVSAKGGSSIDGSGGGGGGRIAIAAGFVASQLVCLPLCLCIYAMSWFCCRGCSDGGGVDGLF